MIQVVLIEDEKPAARQLKKLATLNDLDVIAVIHSVTEGKKWFEENQQPDLIISDIQLGDGLSFDIFDQFELTCFLLFTTAYDQFTLRAFKLNSIDYLLKPLGHKAFSQAIQKFKTYQKPFNFNQFKHILQEEKLFKERFVINIGQQLKIITISEIEGFVSENKATYLFIKERRYLIDESLDDLSELIDPKFFFRVNRQYIIQLSSIERIVSYTNARLKLTVKSIKEPIIVSRERVKSFKMWLGK